MRMPCAAKRFRLNGIIGCLSIAGLALSGAAVAQEQGATEVPIGTFTLGSPSGFSIVEPPGGVPESKRDDSDGGSGRWFFQSWDQAQPSNAAERQLKDALKALDEGHTADAQRLLERLIAEAPQSKYASDARRHLGLIYSGAIARPAVATSAMETGATDASPLNESSQTAGGAKALKVSRAVPREVLARVRVPGYIDSQFLSAAGDRVFFSPGSASLGARARGVIQAQARFLLGHPELSAVVEGHADDGALPADEMEQLSEQRAAVVRDGLVMEGVNAQRLVAYGRGRDDRVSDCAAPECLAQNRRAVTVLVNGALLADTKATLRADRDLPTGVSPTQ